MKIMTRSVYPFVSAAYRCVLNFVYRTNYNKKKIMTVLNCEKMGCQIDTVPDSVHLLNISFNLALIKRNPAHKGSKPYQNFRARFSR